MAFFHAVFNIYHLEYFFFDTSNPHLHSLTFLSDRFVYCSDSRMSCFYFHFRYSLTDHQNLPRSHIIQSSNHIN